MTAVLVALCVLLSLAGFVGLGESVPDRDVPSAVASGALAAFGAVCAVAVVMFS